MSFNSYVFILSFLPLTLLIYFYLGKVRKYKTANIFIVLMSLFFYAYYNPIYLLMLFLSMIVNYSVFMLLSKNKNKNYLIISILLNVCLLLYFKYYNFFISSINDIFKTSIATKQLLLPLAISFYTFSNISFVVDSYNNEIRNCSLLEYVLYISFFPKMIQGPLVKYNELMNQFNDNELKKIHWLNIQKGLLLFVLGLSKKVLIADALVKAVNWGYSNIAKLDSLNSLIVMLCYTLQIYFDFSGYSDMARGIACMFNIDLPFNFDSPYLSKNISEFWKKWHISLTNFLTKYIYIPLGGNRKGVIRTYLNIMSVFIISGFWHGASWNYVLWGFLNGLLMIIYRSKKDWFNRLPNGVSWLLTFVMVNLLWIIFRSDNINDAFLMISRLFRFKSMSLNQELISCFEISMLNYVPESFDFIRVFKTSRLYVFAYIAMSFFIIVFEKRIKQYISNTVIKRVYFYLFGLLLIICILSLTSNSSFIYVGF